MAIKRAKVTRKQRVLDAMRNYPDKTITAFYAINELGDTRLAATIHQLKKDGHEISKEMLEGTNKFGDDIRYAKYKLEKEAEVEGHTSGGLKVTRENRDEFFGYQGSIGWDAIIGGNGLQYMQVTISPDVIGTQHFKYPTEWFNELLVDKKEFGDIRISGAYHVRCDGNTFNRPFKYIKRDMPEYNDGLRSHHGNLNGYRCDVEDELLKEFSNLRGMIFYRETESNNRKILIILED